MPSSYWTAHTWASSPSSLRTTPPQRSRRAPYRESPQPITLYANQSICGPAEADGLDPPGLDRQAPLRPLATAKPGEVAWCTVTGAEGSPGGQAGAGGNGGMENMAGTRRPAARPPS